MTQGRSCVMCYCIAMYVDVKDSSVDGAVYMVAVVLKTSLFVNIVLVV